MVRMARHHGMRSEKELFFCRVGNKTPMTLRSISLRSNYNFHASHIEYCQHWPPKYSVCAGNVESCRGDFVRVAVRVAVRRWEV